MPAAVLGLSQPCQKARISSKRDRVWSYPSFHIFMIYPTSFSVREKPWVSSGAMRSTFPSSSRRNSRSRLSL